MSRDDESRRRRRSSSSESSVVAASILRAVGILVGLYALAVIGHVAWSLGRQRTAAPPPAAVPSPGDVPPVAPLEPKRSATAGPKKEEKKYRKPKEKPQENKKPKPKPPKPPAKKKEKKVKVVQITEEVPRTTLTALEIAELRSSFPPPDDVYPSSLRLADDLSGGGGGDDAESRLSAAIDDARSSVDETRDALQEYLTRHYKKRRSRGPRRPDASELSERYLDILGGYRELAAMSSFAYLTAEDLAERHERAATSLLRLLEMAEREGEVGGEFRALDDPSVVLGLAGIVRNVDDEFDGTCDPSFLVRESPTLIEDDEEDDAVVAKEEEDDDKEDDKIYARESDLIYLVGRLEKELRRRLEYASSSSATDGGAAPKSGPLSEEANGRILDRIDAMVEEELVERRAREEEERLLREEEEQRRREEQEEGGEEEEEEEEEEPPRICVDESGVELMVEEGLLALRRKSDLRDALVRAVERIGGGGNESELILDAHFPEEPSSSAGPGKNGGGNGSSWSHANSARTLVPEVLLSKTLGVGLDKLAEALGGYNDHLDAMIDYLAAGGEDDDDREDGNEGSVGKAAVSKLLDALGKVPIPDLIGDMKRSAGILSRVG